MALDTVWRGMICKQLINIYLGSSNSCLIFSQLPQIGQNVSYFGVYVGCLEGISEVSGDCLWVSGSYLGVSGRCLVEYRCHKNKQLNRSRHIKLLLFLPVASD